MVELQQSNRLFFIDKLKTYLVILVILHHTMITYGASGGWYFRDPAAGDNMLFTIFAGFNQAYFMGLLFLMSSYFTPGSFSRHGVKKYITKRLIRFGIPLLVYIFAINPIIVYFLFVRSGGIHTFFEFYLDQFRTGTGIYSFFSGNGPLWFILVLLLFSVCYFFYKGIFKNNPEKKIDKKPPDNLFLILIILSMAGLTFLMRLIFSMDTGEGLLNIQYAFVVQYIVMLILGVMAYRRDWFRQISVNQGKLWLIVLAISMVYYGALGALSGAFEGDLSKLMGGFHWQAFAFNIWESTFCIGMSICLIVLFREKFNGQTKISQWVSGDSYTMYLLHAPVLVVISVLFKSLLIPVYLKFAIVAVLTVLCCWLISHFILRRIPGVKKIL